MDNDGKFLEGEAEGNLVLTDSWPGQMRTVYGDHERFVQTYFSSFPGTYFSGDGARRDALLLQPLAQALEHALLQRGGGREDLGDGDAARLLLDQRDVGEGAADVHRDAQPRRARVLSCHALIPPRRSGLARP